MITTTNIQDDQKRSIGSFGGTVKIIAIVWFIVVVIVIIAALYFGSKYALPILMKTYGIK